MALTTVLSNNVVFQTRDAVTGGTCKTWVCNTTLSGNLASAVTTTSTKCGVIKSVGEVGGTVNFGGVANVTPDADEISLKDAVGFAAAKTLLEGRLVNLADSPIALGEAILIKGDGYVSSITPNADADTSLTFDAVFEFSGSIDVEESDES
jgi:hypothetical protein